jgi:hypothetical protein
MWHLVFINNTKVHIDVAAPAIPGRLPALTGRPDVRTRRPAPAGTTAARDPGHGPTPRHEPE